MSKKNLPTYSLNNLNEKGPSPKDFMADHFGHYLDEHPNLHFPHKHSFYHLVYFSKGAGSHSIDFTSFPVQAGQVYFMIPGQVHSWEFSGTPEGYIVNFSDQFLYALLANPGYLEQFAFFSGIAGEQVISIPAGERVQIEQLLKIIVNEFNSKKKLKDDIVRTALLQFFIYVNRCIPPNPEVPQNNYNSILLRNFQKLIEQYYKEKKLTKEYAAILFVTPNHLNALCKAITGKPAGEMIRDRILLEAKRLLVNAKMTISEIATELNFMDNSYFTKFFKKYEGVTPEVFRKQISAK